MFVATKTSIFSVEDKSFDMDEEERVEYCEEDKTECWDQNNTSSPQDQMRGEHGQ